MPSACASPEINLGYFDIDINEMSFNFHVLTNLSEKSHAISFPFPPSRGTGVRI
jgi:hypothetical protein